ncbi:MAG: ABC transporter permease [Oscillospiraceae bacterium]|nr:ABC transporter permease [Oscillospiraceae bacterium]
MANSNMKKNPLSGIGRVYTFTLKQMCAAKGWLISTILIGALLLLGIPLILFISSAKSDDSDSDDKARIRTVFVCDETDGTADYSVLSQGEKYKDVKYQTFGGMNDAISAITDKNSTVILRVTKPDSTIMLTVYLPEDSDISRSKASSFADYAQESFAAVLMQKAELTPEHIMLLSMPVSTSASELKLDAAKDDEEENILVKVLSILLPFLMLMLVYMMVVLYGASMANSVMLEKNSKLVETVLTAVNPVALMGGKLFATATAAILQILIWIGCGIGGAIGGVFFAKQIVPETQSSAVQSVSQVIDNSEIFSLSGILLAIVILALGFLLYLSLGAIAGALASKAEDLSKTNVVFILVLIISFFMCMGSPGEAEKTDSMISSAVWIRYFPFTALLVNPSELMLGKSSMLTAFLSIAIMILTVALIVYLAAGIYRMLLFYRGNPPTPAKLLAMRKDSKQKKHTDAE